MITFIEGLNGEGKSWLMAELLYKEWKQGAKIFSNFPLCFPTEDNIERWHLLQELYHLKNGIIAIDEASKLFHARRWQSTPMSFIELITQHRKQFLDVITTSPSISDIDYEIRKKIHERFTCQSIIRIPANQRVHPIFQWIRVVKRKRIFTDNADTLKWQVVEKPKHYFLSRFWTKKRYETYASVGMSKLICHAEYKLKSGKKKAEWLINITDRDLINSGRARK